MKQFLSFCIAMAVFAIAGFSQALTPLVDGEYNTSANDVVASSIGIPDTYKVMAQMRNSSQDKFSLAVTRNGSYGNAVDYERFEGNIFAPKKNGLWETPTNLFVVLQPGAVMELYVTKNAENNVPEIDRVIAISVKGAKFGDLKKSAKDHADAFKFVDYNNKLAKANEAAKVKLAEEEAARKAAAAKAAEEKRIADEKAKADREAKAAADKAAREQAIAERKAGLAKADYCTALNKYAAMGSRKFKPLKGDVLPQSEMYTEKNDTTFKAAELLQYFDKGVVQTHNNAYDKFCDVTYYMVLSSKEEVEEYYALVQPKVHACFNGKSGWTLREIMGSPTYYGPKAYVSLAKVDNKYDDDKPRFAVEVKVTSR